MLFMTEKDIKKLKETDAEITLLSHTSAMLSWDQETYIPSGSIEERSRQLSLLSGLIHKRLTSAEEIFSGVKLKTISPLILYQQPTAVLSGSFMIISGGRQRFRRTCNGASRQASITQSVWVEARKG